MKLVFYSGGDNSQNEKIDLKLVELLSKKPQDSRMCFIPADGFDKGKKYFEAVKEYYEKYGFEEFIFCAVDRPVEPEVEKEVLSCDVIYLSGGNTFYFLKYLRAAGYIEKLRKYAEAGGMLIGVSAGSIIMTPSIELSAVPSDNCDENEVGLKDFTGMGLMKFEFFPHYDGRKVTDEELAKYAERLDYPVYVCRDGEGVVVDGEDIQLVGDVKVI